MCLSAFVSALGRHELGIIIIIIIINIIVKYFDSGCCGKAIDFYYAYELCSRTHTGVVARALLIIAFFS